MSGSRLEYIGGYDADRRVAVAIAVAVLEANHFHCRAQHMPTNSVKVITVIIGIPPISRRFFYRRLIRRQ